MIWISTWAGDWLGQNTGVGGREHFFLTVHPYVMCAPSPVPVHYLLTLFDKALETKIRIGT